MERCCYVIKNGNPCPFNGKHNYEDKYYCGKHLHMVKAREECSICYNSMEQKALRMKLCCGHYFHKKCLAQCHKAECPLCRTSFTVGESYAIYQETVIEPISKSIFCMSKNVHAIVFNCVRMSISICEKGDWYINMLSKLLATLNKHLSSPAKLYDGISLLIETLESA